MAISRSSSMGLVLFAMAFLILMIQETADGCTAVGGRCFNSNDCCSKACRHVGTFSTFDETRNNGECVTPCKNSGECTRDEDCCFKRKCSLPTDADPVRKCVKCLPHLDFCEVNSDCCSGDCVKVTSFDSVCGGDPGLCKEHGEYCVLSSDCCYEDCISPVKGSIFVDLPRCGGSTRCNKFGYSCSLSSDCCSGNCTIPPKGSTLEGDGPTCGLQCSGSGEQCKLSSDCCSGNCTSPAKGSIFEKDGPSCGPRCSKLAGQCKLSSDCCNGNCTLGLCTLPIKIGI